MLIKAGLVVDKYKVVYRKIEKNLSIKDNEVLLKIKAVGICGSDLGFIKNVYNPNLFKKPPILGHEFVGEVVGLGENIVNKKICKNDLVVADCGIYCGKCEYCIRGDNNLCEEVKFYGYPPFDGALQEYLIFPADFVYKLPSSIMPNKGVLAEPLAVCLHAFDLAKFQTGMNVAVIGCGFIGLTLIKLLKMMGANKIIGIEPLSYRRKMAKKFGADVILSENNIEMSIKRNKIPLSDIVFEAASSEKGTRIITKIIKNGGKVIIIGIPKRDDIINISHLEARKKGLTIKMVRRLRNTIQRSLMLLEKGFKIDDLITHRIDIKNIEEAFKLALFNTDKVLKVIITF